MHPITKKVAVYYGAWVLLWVAVAIVGNAVSGHGEFAISSHLVLSFSGFPLALLSWHILPNASILGISAAGLIGIVQWCAVAEVNAWLNDWQRSRRRST